MYDENKRPDTLKGAESNSSNFKAQVYFKLI